MFPYSEERFTADEETVLRRYVTNLDLPVFALVNLPEVVKGALFARYSRSPKSLRRLFLDEFVGDLDVSGDASVDATVGLAARRAALREGVRRVRRRLGGAARRRPPGVRAGVQRALQGARVGTAHGLPRAVDALHRLQPAARQRPVPLLPPARDPRLAPRRPLRRRDGPRLRHLRRAAAARCRHGWPSASPNRPDDSDFVYRQATRAKSLDALRGLLPAASLSNIGVYGTGQSYEQLLLRMRAHPLPEARHYADHDAGRAAQGHPVVPPTRRRRRAREGSGRRTSTSTRDQTDALVRRLWPELTADLGERVRRRRRGDPARLRSRRRGEGPGGGVFRRHWIARSAKPSGGCAGSGTTTAWRCCGPTSATGATAGTVPVGPSSARTIASSWSRTTARSVICSGIAC